ncbi:hypothetical protein O6H91_06G037500 [Diphasiastrum complanatum]|uniref:Uncharacterized protein n=5 Tax=Diphasiastrum complanatum TaxID=34168 RepID=A0ACC2DCM3_DIPCM|nr:hypothetical protein O6H91_06G037500 [Diphasiastrum complanatum]KAJ7551996.1 hypothetical protein O6H91_06G037500 [Diphasiastrum complanatum]
MKSNKKKMGCNQSKIEDEESVSRCKRQKRLVKQAVKSRNAFASAHASYLQALHNAGTAFRKFAEGEFREQTLLPATPTTPPLSPLPSTPASQSTPELPRSISLPPMALKNTPLASETVVLSPSTILISPPRSPKYKLEQDYLFNDAPPLDLYRSMQRPGSPSFPNDPGSPPSPPAPIITGWDWFNLFEPPPMAIHLKQQRSYRQMRGEGEFEQIIREDVPTLDIEGRSSKNTEKQEQQKTDGPGGEKPEETAQISEQEPQEAKQENPQPKDQVQEQKMEEHKEQQESEKNDVAVEVVTASSEPSSEPPDQKLESENRELNVIAPLKGKDLPDVLRDIEEEFLRASESGKDISRMLEASKVHYQSNFLDSKGLSEHSSRLLRGLSWNSWSPRTPLSWTGTEASEESSTSEETGMTSSHSSTLDKLYAWEKKLYQEVKEVELINVEFEKKQRLLRNLSAKGDDDEKIDKTRGALKALETQMMVAFQAMEATSASIKKITNEEMYPQLLELLEGLTSMWKVMSECHQRQKDALLVMKTTEKLPLESTGEIHREATIELEAALNNWQLFFGTLISTQREYIQSLTGWLKLSSFKPEKVSKRPSAAGKITPMFYLCTSWQTQLEKLPDKPVIDAIRKFSDTVHEIIWEQTEKQRVHKRRETLAKELSKKILILNQEEKKFMEPVLSKDESGIPVKSSLAEKRESVETFRKTVEEEKENFTRAIERTRALTMEGLQKGLPELFRVLSDFAAECSRAYQNLLSQVRDGKLGQEQD